MVLVKYSPQKSKIECSEIEKKILYPKLDKELAYFHEGYFFTPAYEMGFWDGKTHFFSIATGKFHSGFLSRVLKLINKLGLQADVVDYPD
ncbi:MAG TPA: hypothetical protein VIY48_00810, partial [Candidatus Paceibacterota bacterium]